MKLEAGKRHSCFDDEYECELTRELDRLSGIDTKEYYEHFSHYILTDRLSKKDKCYPVRVPGGTVGGVWVDDDNVITKIVIDTNYVVKTYPEDVNEQMKKFIGQKIEV